MLGGLSDPEGVDRTNSSPTGDHEGSDGFTGFVRDGSESSARFTKRAEPEHADGLSDTTAVRVEGLTPTPANRDTSFLKSAEPVHAEGLSCTQANRDGLDSHTSGQVLTRKRLPTKITMKAELIGHEKLAIRLDESGFSMSSEFRAQSPFRMRPQVSRRKKPSCAPFKSLTDGSAGDATIDDQGVQQVPMDLPDIVLLYRTLVADGGLPPGYEEEFSTLGPVLESAAQRQDRRIRELSNMEASVLPQAAENLRKRRTPKIQRPLQTSSYGQRRCRLAGTCPAYSAASTRPRARKDTEEKERARWVEVLGSMLVHTPTPMGRILRDKPCSLQLFGAGRRASTFRSRVRAMRRYLNWLALNHDVGYLCELDHVTGYLLARRSKPCTRNALRGAHTALALMEEVAGVEQSKKITGAQVYAIIQKEILANKLPSRPSKQAPDYFNA